MNKPYLYESHVLLQYQQTAKQCYQYGINVLILLFVQFEEQDEFSYKIHLKSQLKN